jgi:hypothetical protein
MWSESVNGFGERIERIEFALNRHVLCCRLLTADCQLVGSPVVRYD